MQPHLQDSGALDTGVSFVCDAHIEPCSHHVDYGLALSIALWADCSISGHGMACKLSHIHCCLVMMVTQAAVWSQ